MIVCDNCRQPTSENGGDGGNINVYGINLDLTAASDEVGVHDGVTREWCDVCALAVVSSDWATALARKGIGDGSAQRMAEVPTRKKPGPKPGSKRTPKPVEVAAQVADAVKEAPTDQWEYDKPNGDES